MAYRITRPSDSSFYPGQIVSDEEFNRMVQAIIRQGGEAPLGERVPEHAGAERTLVLLEDIAYTGYMEDQAKKLGGKMESKLEKENSALFSLPTKSAANDFMFVARQQGYQASIHEPIFPGIFSPLDALREDAERIRRAMKKPPLRPPWAT